MRETEIEGKGAELTRVESELCKQDFHLYDKNKNGYVERFELPMMLTGIFLFVSYLILQ